MPICGNAELVSAGKATAHNEQCECIAEVLVLKRFDIVW